MKYRKGYDYQLAEMARFQTAVYPLRTAVTEFIALNAEGVLVISSGYAWDGPSGPTLNTDNAMVPSLVHDAIYQLIRERLISVHWRKEADAMLYRMLRERGMSWPRAQYWLAGVRWFAAGAANPGDTKEVFEVS